MTIKDIHEEQQRAFEHGQDDAIRGLPCNKVLYSNKDRTVKNAYIQGWANGNQTEGAYNK